MAPEGLPILCAPTPAPPAQEARLCPGSHLLGWSPPSPPACGQVQSLLPSPAQVLVPEPTVPTVMASAAGWLLARRTFHRLGKDTDLLCLWSARARRQVSLVYAQPRGEWGLVSPATATPFSVFPSFPQLCFPYFQALLHLPHGFPFLISKHPSSSLITLFGVKIHLV